MNKLSKKEKDKLDLLVRWIFNGILQNIYVTIPVKNNQKTFKVNNLPRFNLEESNTGAFILLTIGIEVFGRLLLRFSNEHDVSKRSFVTFIRNFFPKQYIKRSEKLYHSLRCNLVHNYILKYSGNNGWFLTRQNRQLYQNHLEFMPGTRRLIVHLEKFFLDFKSAVEQYIDILEKMGNQSIWVFVGRRERRWRYERVNYCKNFLKAIKYMK